MEHRALGRGINALIPETEFSEKVMQLPVDKIEPNPLQPRETFDQQDMDDLVGSIREKGVIQPVLVRRRGDGFELIAGERRFRAAKLLNLASLPAIVKDVDDRDSLELALIENIQRQNLNPIEEARAYKYLIEKFQLNQDEVSQVLGKARATVTNVLRLLKLPPEIQDEIKNGRISFGHGKALLEIDDANQQRRLSQLTIAKALSVRELESAIKNVRKSGRRLSVRTTTLDPMVTVFEQQLQQVLATKVRIIKKKKRGSIVVDFYSNEDLGRIVEKIGGLTNL
jgi:ParB family transcriptional regulator, chromosome partitioning protein